MLFVLPASHRRHHSVTPAKYRAACHSGNFSAWNPQSVLRVEEPPSFIFDREKLFRRMNVLSFDTRKRSVHLRGLGLSSLLNFNK